jgi:hypothetical protein
MRAWLAVVVFPIERLRRQRDRIGARSCAGRQAQQGWLRQAGASFLLGILEPMAIEYRATRALDPDMASK